jgi:lycopene cyclase domain-containing protein
MAACAAGTLPLEWVFRARVYRQPARLARALVLPFAAFVVWDAIAIARGWWTFSPTYTTGWHVPFDVPVEELAFFIVIPICALLSYESVRQIVKR